MIKKIQVLKGFPLELKGVGNKVFNFTENLNVLFGPNGCGKSTLLKILKSYSGIQKAGWSQISQKSILPARELSHFPHIYHIFSPGESYAHVEWDGTPSFYNEGDVKDDVFGMFFNNAAMSNDGLTTGNEMLETLALKPSSGQYRLQKLNKILNMIDNPPTLSGFTVESQYIASLPKTGRVTLLFDEPERALSLPKQMELFRLLVDISKEKQVIIATHSPFVLLGIEANIIDLEEGYSQQCLDIFKQFLEVPQSDN